MSQKPTVIRAAGPPTRGRGWCIVMGAMCMAGMTSGCRQASTADRTGSAPHLAEADGTPADQPSVVEPTAEESPFGDVPERQASTAREGFGGEAAGWLRIELLREDAAVGWATGSIHAGSNSIEIETEGAKRIELDLSEIQVDWNRRVILRLDGQASQLLHGKTQIKHFEVTPAGRWRIIRGEEAAATSAPVPTD